MIGKNGFQRYFKNSESPYFTQKGIRHFIVSGRPNCVGADI